MTPRQRTYGRGRVFRKREAGVEVGNYVARWYVGGQERNQSTGTTDPAAAIRFLNDRIADAGSGRAPVAGVQRITVGDLLDDLIAHQEVERYPSLRTTRTHDVVLRRALGTIRAANLTTKALQQFVTALRKPGARKGPKGKPVAYADATIGRFLDTLKAALNLGRAATPPTVATVPVFPVVDESGNVRQGFATAAQCVVILDVLRQRDPDVADAVAWAIWTGMRKGAVARLGWDAWDLDTQTLRLPPAGRKKRTPKAIPLRAGHPLRAILDRRWQRRKDRAKDTGRLEPLIFWRVHRGAPTQGVRPGDAVPVYEYRKLWRTAVRAAGNPTLTPHDLRRTSIRNSWAATKDRRTAMLLSGHATESVFERYRIDTGDDLVGHLDAIAGYVAQLPTGTPAAVPTLPARRRRKLA
jgi:integrase